MKTMEGETFGNISEKWCRDSNLRACYSISSIRVVRFEHVRELGRVSVPVVYSTNL